MTTCLWKIKKKGKIIIIKWTKRRENFPHLHCHTRFCHVQYNNRREEEGCKLTTQAQGKVEVYNVLVYMCKYEVKGEYVKECIFVCVNILAVLNEWYFFHSGSHYSTATGCERKKKM